MPLELFYTSAPEGLRPGDKGFCTVAASEGIGRTLWDRLEAMSGYRHLPGVNPVAFAHWILNLDGSAHHVLSRVADAGLDYTQRTNSLAHHLVLDSHELPPGGPVYLLQQPGVMATQWNGRVGVVPPRTLPTGDVSPTMCPTWQRLAGDAGWAGMAAQLIATSPWKSIGMIYAPGTDVLPLIAEAVALLPASLRWQATFNTYFTNLPGGMTCQWRCCPVDTPATAAVARAAAGGMLIDLTRVPQLAPDNPWTEAARAGRPVPINQKAAAKPTPKPIALKPLAETAPPPVEEAEEPLDRPSLAARGDQAVIIPRGGVKVRASNQPAAPPAAWIADSKKRRQRMMLVIYGLAIVIIALGTWMAITMHHLSSDLAVGPPAPPPVSQPVEPEPTIHVPVVPPPVTAPVTQAVAPLPPKPTTEQVVEQPATVPMTAPAPPPPPAAIALDHPLPPPPPGKGMRDPVVAVPLGEGKIEHPDDVEKLELTFPDGSRRWAMNQPEMEGVFEAEFIANHFQPALNLTWRESSDAKPQPVVTVSLDKSTASLNFAWSNVTMLRRPAVTQLAYWLLENAQYQLADKAGKRPQKVTFSLAMQQQVSLLDSQAAVKLPENLPLPPQLALGRTQPDGWQQAAGLTAGKAGEQFLRVERPPGDAGILLKWTQEKHALSSDLAQAIDTSNRDLATAQDEAKHAAEDVEQVRKTFDPATQQLQQGIKEWIDRAPQAGNRKPDDPTPDDYQAELQRRQTLLATHLVNLGSALVEPTERLNKAQAKVAALRAALAAYADLKEIDLVVQLPGGLTVGIIRLKRPAP